MQQSPKVIEAAINSTANVTSTPAEGEVKGKVEKKGGKRIGYNYIIIKSLKESQKNDVIKCLYIKSLTKFGFCVIKEGTYGDTKDKDGRDIKDRLVWQKQLHEQLQGKVRVPRYIGSFEERGNYYLVIEKIKGKSLYIACREKVDEIREGLISGNSLGRSFLDYMIQVTSLLEGLHDNQIIHRDVSANNFIVSPSGKVAIIDMELSYSFGRQLPSPPFQLGTFGYMSPQQEKCYEPSVKDDIFSVGAILFQVWTGISPFKMTHIPMDDLSKKIVFFIPDKAMASIIIQCLQREPEKRPCLREVRRVMEEYKHDLCLKEKRPLSKPILFSKEEIIATLQRIIGTLASPLLADENKGWFAEDTGREEQKDKKKINKAWYTSFSKGAAGVLYTLAKANQAGFDTSVCAPHIQKALRLIQKKYMARINEVAPDLHIGSSGIAAALSIAIREKLIQPKSVHFEWISKLISVANVNANYSSGIAGQGLAHFHCYPFLQKDQSRQKLQSYVSRLLAIQEKDGSWINEKNLRKKKATRGFARGTAGILYFLLEYASRMQDKQAIAAAKRGLNWLMKKSIHRNGSIQWKTSEKKKIFSRWSDGAPGIALTFLKAYALWGDIRYKKFATGALLSNPKYIVDNGLGQYSGLSGLGEIYLEAYNILQEDEWLERADWIAQVIMQMKKEHSEYGPYWLVEHERQATSDFMNGNSGVLHFLLRYCYPKNIPFPLVGK